jgi:hypothetical protein
MAEGKHEVKWNEKKSWHEMKEKLLQPHFEPSVRIKTHTLKSENLESPKTPENLELDWRGQNTSH